MKEIITIYEDVDKGIVIRTTLPHDIEYLKDNLRKDDIREVELSSGITPYEALKKSYLISSSCFTALHNNIPFAIFGLNPESLLDDTCVIWLLGTEVITKLKKEFVKLSRMIVNDFFLTYKEMYNLVWSEHVESIRWLKMLGAKFSKPVPHGPNKVSFMKFVLRRT